MRKLNKRITDPIELMQIISKCDVCSVAFYDDEYPYVIPMNFGITCKEGNFTMYFHGSKTGKKIQLLNQNNRVAFELNCNHNLIFGNKACDTSMGYESICGTGIISIVDDNDKITALTAIMNQYRNETEYLFENKHIEKVTLLKLTVNNINGKILKY